MIRRPLNEESGYSLVEVMVSILILAIAILPMVGMLDMGLQTATRGGNYDRARALANLKMEEAKTLPFADVENTFPEAESTPPYDEPSDWFTEDDFTNLEYRIVKEYMDQPPKGTPDDPLLDPQPDFEPSPTPSSLIRVTVIVRWPADCDEDTTCNEYNTFGLVTA